MSANKIFNTTPEPLTTVTPSPTTIMETIEKPDVKSEVDVANTPAHSGSVVVLSDDGASRNSLNSTSTSSDDKPLIQKQAAIAKPDDTGNDEQSGKKRAASTVAEGGPAKKAKVNEEPSITESGEKATGKSKAPETIGELKGKANAIIQKKIARIHELKDELEDTKAERDALEESRDSLRVEKIALDQILEDKASDKKTKAARENESRNKLGAEIKTALKKEYEKKLQEKIAGLEKRLNGKHATAERNLQQKLDAKTEKLEETTEALREAKEDWHNEVRDLRGIAKEQAKYGGVKAQQTVKELKEEIKAKDKEIAQHISDKQRQSGEIIHLKANVNSEKTQLEHMNETYGSTCREKESLEAKAVDYKKRAVFQYNDNKLLKAKHQQEIASIRSQHVHDLREADEKWQLQATNSAESQERVVEAQRKVWTLNQQAISQSKLLEQVSEQNRALGKKLQAAAAEKRKKDEENAKLLGIIARSGVSPLEVLNSTSGEVLKAPEGETPTTSDLRTTASQDIITPAPGFKSSSITQELPRNPFQRTSSGFTRKSGQNSFGATNASQASNTAASRLEASGKLQAFPSLQDNAPIDLAGPSGTQEMGHGPAETSIFGVKPDAITQHDAADEGKLGDSANQYNAIVGGEASWGFK